MEKKQSTEIIVLEVKNTTAENLREVLLFPGPADNKPDSPLVYMVHSHACYSDQLVGMITEDREGDGFTKTVLTGLSINDPISKDWRRSGRWFILGRDGEKLTGWNHSTFPATAHSPYSLRLGLSKIMRLPNIAFDEYFTLSIPELEARCRLVIMLHLLHQ